MKNTMVGKMLDNRYELLEVIGSGGMAVVYKAKCHLLNRLVAVKILKGDLLEDADFRRRFRAESKAVGMLSHPNIVSVYDVSRGDPEYIVMELIDGITLKQYMERRGQLNWREALHFAIQIMKGIGHAHSRNIVHRDIKPQNIMVLRDGGVKVTDFGIACLTDSANTMTQEVLGSVHYISPEQAKGNRPDARSDIYSAGVVLYEMLTNRLPFEGENAVSVAIQHLSSVPLSPRDVNPEVPEALEKICMKAMASDIERRYQSVAEMISDLEEFRKNPEFELDFSIEDLRKPESSEPTRYIPAMQAVKDDVEDDVPEGSRMKKLLITLAAAAVAVTALILLWKPIFGSFEQTTVLEFEVPHVIGMTVDEALESPDIRGIFEIVEIGSRESEEYAEGQIIEQSPTSGNIVRTNRKIEVFVSKGIKTAEMENVIGQEYRVAQINLKALELDLDLSDLRYEFSESYTSGCVVRTDPAAGTPLKKGDKVVLYVSKGVEPKPVTVPTFTGMQMEIVRSQLADLGLICGPVSYRTDNSQPSGVVLEQSIVPETVVETGAVITFVVNDAVPAPVVDGSEAP
ncbi:MAG: Stk1 family PASTA domain-containing Ser/Thr kinase [Oscillospiraceae bacterium]|nr:Stk1 family PASTA domain-containing Ser/Thr kinase [Oscillospiraceae bacterium]